MLDDTSKNETELLHHVIKPQKEETDSSLESVATHEPTVSRDMTLSANIATNPNNVVTVISFYSGNGCNNVSKHLE